MRLAALTLARFLGPAVLCAAGLLVLVQTLCAADAAARSVITPIGSDAETLDTDWVPVGNPGDFRYRFVTSGIDPADLARGQAANWSAPQWQTLFSVSIGKQSPSGPILQPMAGSYTVQGNTLIFEPAFPLNPDTIYSTRLKRSSTTEFTTPKRPERPATSITHVYPSADVLPENLLKFYIHFSAPMNRGDIYKYIHLLDDTGKQVYLPFLELGEELWNPAMTRVTVFIDPGRIKRGVRELMEHGPALTGGKSHTLVIDDAWTDGNGKPLKESFRKAFRVEKDDRIAIDPKQWKVTPSSAGSIAALQITFPEPLDHALAERLIQVVAVSGGTRRYVAGTATLSDQERRLSFVPDQPWTAGAHELEIPTILEDLAGNKVGKVFDVDVFEEVTRTVTPDTVALPFAVK